MKEPEFLILRLPSDSLGNRGELCRDNHAVPEGHYGSYSFLLYQEVSHTAWRGPVHSYPPMIFSLAAYVQLCHLTLRLLPSKSASKAGFL